MIKIVKLSRLLNLNTVNEKLAALKSISDKVLKNRWEDAREPNQKELTVPTVIRIEIEEASAKMRGGMPIDDDSDYALPIWAGILPINETFGDPIRDEKKLLAAIDLPNFLDDVVGKSRKEFFNKDGQDSQDNGKAG